MRCLFHTSAARFDNLILSPREHLEFPNLYDVDQQKPKSSSCPFAGAKKAPKREKIVQTFKQGSREGFSRQR